MLMIDQNKLTSVFGRCNVVPVCATRYDGEAGRQWEGGVRIQCWHPCHHRSTQGQRVGGVTMETSPRQWRDVTTATGWQPMRHRHCCSRKVWYIHEQCDSVLDRDNWWQTGTCDIEETSHWYCPQPPISLIQICRWHICVCVRYMSTMVKKLNYCLVDKKCIQNVLVSACIYYCHRILWC